LKVINVLPVPASSIDIGHTTETNDFDKEFAKLDDATTFEGQPYLNPSAGNEKYHEDGGGGNVPKGQSIELSSGKEIIPPVTLGNEPCPFCIRSSSV
jgi:hypothetical protein